MIFVEGEDEVEGEGEGGDRSESKVAWALAWTCWGDVDVGLAVG